MRENQKEADCMRERMRKLALWCTRTFTPIINHDELEPIMATLGFVAVPNDDTASTAVAWKEYYSSASGWFATHLVAAEPLPRPRLPYPKIDGLHISTYTAFLDALNFYLQMSDISDLFHVRGVELHKTNDRSKKWCRMEEDDNIFVYRDGTLDQAGDTSYQVNKNDVNGSSNKGRKTIIREKGKISPTGCIVSLKDISETIIVGSNDGRPTKITQ
ncbi:unnamed protein product [Ilex paraguariensis]|uniref:Uncharacterized protein n=1 Tax=Ilex paraguariensis TaxID=185542 RepID=A0ABC8R593_9AQUA